MDGGATLVMDIGFEIRTILWPYWSPFIRSLSFGFTEAYVQMQG